MVPVTCRPDGTARSAGLAGQRRPCHQNKLQASPPTPSHMHLNPSRWTGHPVSALRFSTRSATPPPRPPNIRRRARIPHPLMLGGGGRKTRKIIHLLGLRSMSRLYLVVRLVVSGGMQSPNVSRPNQEQAEGRPCMPTGMTLQVAATQPGGRLRAPASAGSSAQLLCRVWR